MEEAVVPIYKLLAHLKQNMLFIWTLGMCINDTKIHKIQKIILTLDFFFVFNSPENTEYNSLILTYKNIDKKTFFSIPVHFRSVDDIIKELDKPSELKWPC